MRPACFAKVIGVLMLVICKEGSTEEHTEAGADEEPPSREKRGLNMLRLGRGLQMLRLGKRGGLNMLRLGRNAPDSEDLEDYLYRTLAHEENVGSSLVSGDDYLSPASRYRRSTDRAVALPRIGKESDEMYEKRALGMLRLGRSGFDGLDMHEAESDDKRALGMLRLGKRPMSMLRLGKRPMSMLRLGKRPMSMLRLGKRPMSMLRLGKRPMSMLRLGKRPMSMLRLGKRQDDENDKRALGMLRLGKRSTEGDGAPQ